MTKYVIIEWPDSQVLMEEEWFHDECFLINDEHHLETYGSCAFFVPEERYMALTIGHFVKANELQAKRDEEVNKPQ